MQEKILALYELQKIDSKIDEINKVKGELPLEVQDLEDEMTGLKPGSTTSMPKSRS